MSESSDKAHNEKKRGMKPRSKRNRKRPRSEKHALESIDHKTSIQLLELDGEAVPSSATWLRKVEPYPYTFSTFAKARWVGRTVLDVYHSEFGSYPKAYYESAIRQGRILVSDQTVPLDHVIKGSDVLTHTVHRHEPGIAVYSEKAPYVHVLQDTAEVLVVDKPGTMPIHPCGGYHIQCLMNLLEPQVGKLYTIHRLDRLTSGLVVLGKTSQVAQEWGKNIMNRNCEKLYLARVKGKFPAQCPATLKHVGNSAALPNHGEWAENSQESGDERMKAVQKNAHGYWLTNGNGEVQKDASLQQVFESPRSEECWFEEKAGDLLWLNLACPTRIAQPKDGICNAGTFEELEDAEYLKTVKPAETAFGVVRYDEATDSTVVICRPATGRTHQIRLHLQYLGHPIANDPNYGGDIWYGNETGQKACRIAQERLDAINSANQEEMDRKRHGSGPSSATIDVPATDVEIQQGVATAVKEEEESIHDFIRRTCVWCARSRNTIGGTDRTALEFLIRSPGIWLHALQYSFLDVSGGATKRFRAPLPSWHKFE